LNLKEYISSGILEAYALGDLTETERAEVERNLHLFPELREELERIEDAQEEFLMRTAVTPSARVKEKLFASIEEDVQTKTVHSNAAVTTETRVVSFNDPSKKWWRFATAASVSIAVLSSYLAFNYKSKLEETEQSLTELIARNQQIAQEYNVVNQRLDNIESTLQVIDNPSFKRVVMKGTDGAPGALASIYWNESTSEVYLSIQQLREISKDQQFQLWAIVDGKPVDAGVFNLTAGLVKMKDVSRASAFAVTIEPTGGSVSPTLSSMQVIGTI
jgi:anti-sigma-K factor RskA